MYAGSMKLGMTVGEAAEAWGCPESTIRRWAAEGHIEAQKVGRDWLILSGEPPDLSRGRPPKQPDSQKN